MVPLPPRGSAAADPDPSTLTEPPAAQRDVEANGYRAGPRGAGDRSEPWCWILVCNSRVHRDRLLQAHSRGADRERPIITRNRLAGRSFADQWNFGMSVTDQIWNGEIR